MLKKSPRKISTGIFCLLFLLNCTDIRGQGKYEAMYNAAIRLLPDQAIQADSLARKLLIAVNTEQPESDSLTCMANYLMGLTQYYLSGYFLAEKYFKKVVEITWNGNNTTIREAAFHNLGIIYDKQDKITESLKMYQQSLRIAESRSDSFSIVQTLINISLLENKMSNNTRAISLGNLLLDFSIRNSDTLNQALCHQNLGLFYRSLENRQKADEHDQDALRLYRLIGDKFYLLEMLINLAESKCESRQFDVSDHLLAEAESICTGLDNDDLMATILLRKGINARERGVDLKLSEKYLLQAEEISKQIADNDKLIEIYSELTTLYARTGRLEQFREAFRNYRMRTDSLNSEKTISAFEQIRAFYELDKLSAQKLKLENDIRIRNRQLILAIGLISLFVLAGIIILYQRFRMNSYIRTLFRLNVSRIRHPEVIPYAESQSEVADSEDQSQNPSLKRYKNLMQLLVHDKLYLNPDLTIQDLITPLSTNQKYLSQAINEFSGTNFYGLVNGLRVEEACRLMLEQGKNCNLKEIADQSGFANRVSFYRNLKEITGFSPSQFLKMASDPDQVRVENVDRPL